MIHWLRPVESFHGETLQCAVLFALCNLLLINTCNFLSFFFFFTSFLSHFSRCRCYVLSACRLWRINTLCEKAPLTETNVFWEEGSRRMGRSAAPTRLWRWDTALVVADRQLWWDTWGWEERRRKNLQVSKASVLTRAALIVVFRLGGRGTENELSWQVSTSQS